MDFDFTEEQALLRESLRRLITREYTFEHSAAFWRRLADQGLLALGLPEADGGCGGPMEIRVVMEELGRGLVLEPFVSTVLLGAGLIRDQGTVAQRAKLLPPIIAGECRMALAHQEAQGSYVLEPINTVARRGKGSYLLNGSKALVPDAGVADMLVVSARDDSAGGLSLFLVAPDASGLEAKPFRTPDGRSAADLTLKNVKVATSARLGCAGFALTALEQAVHSAIAAWCAEAVGVMEAINETCLEHLDRSKRPGVCMVEMLVMAMQAQSMTCLATKRCRESRRADRCRALGAAAVSVGHAARFIGNRAMRLYGGVGASAQARISDSIRRLSLIEMVILCCHKPDSITVL
jgi:alkylation response protein AidB-like acyl-CoA dehydrogenase